MDEAAAKLKMEIDSLPTEIDVLDRKIVQLEIEKEGLKKEKDKTAKEKLGDTGIDKPWQWSSHNHLTALPSWIADFGDLAFVIALISSGKSC